MASLLDLADKLKGFFGQAVQQAPRVIQAVANPVQYASQQAFSSPQFKPAVAQNAYNFGSNLVQQLPQAAQAVSNPVNFMAQQVFQQPQVQQPVHSYIQNRINYYQQNPIQKVFDLKQFAPDPKFAGLPTTLGTTLQNIGNTAPAPDPYLPPDLNIDPAFRIAGQFAKPILNSVGQAGKIKLGPDITRKVSQKAGQVAGNLAGKIPSENPLLSAISRPENRGNILQQTPQLPGKIKIGGGQSNTPSGTDDILRSGYAEIGSLAQAPKKSLGQKFDEFYTNWVDRFNPIVKAAEQVEKKGKAEGFMLRPENNPKYTLKKFLGMGGIAEQRYNTELKPVLDQIDQFKIPQQDMDLYLKSRRDINLGERGIKGSDSEVGAQRAQLLEQKYGDNIKNVADQLYAYQSKGFQELADAGFFSPEVAQSIKDTNANYVPFQRVMDQVDEYLGIPSKSIQQGVNPVKSIKGSDKQIYSPIESVIANTFKQRAAIEKNNVTKSIAGLGKFLPELGITPLRTAENVNKRIDLYSQAKELKPVQDATERLLSTSNQWARNLVSELNSLNRKGIDLRLKQSNPSPGEIFNPTSQLKTKTYVKAGKVVTDTGDTFEVPFVDKITRETIPANPSAKQVKTLVNSLVNLEPAELSRIKNSIALRDSKLANVMDTIQSLKEQLEVIKSSKSQLIDEAKLLRDAESNGKSTVAVWNNGVRELYEVPKDIADSVKGMNEENMNSFLKILEYPASLLRQGATGRNPEFMLPNMIRDQFDAATNSQYGYTPFLDWAKGLAHIVRRDDVYQAWLNSGGAQVMSSMSGRKSVQAMLNEKNVQKRIIPKLFDWLGSGLDKLGTISEQPTRVGLFANAYKKTGNPLIGAMESREGTLDFSRMGAKMKVANSIVPFLNVGIQGFDKMLRTAKSNPAKFAFNMGLYGATPAVMTTLYNVTNHPQEYAEIPQFVKNDNFVIVTGRNAKGTVDYISIPKGNVIRYVANPTESFISYLAGTNPQSLSEFATQFISSGLPVVGDGSSLKEVAIKTIGQNLPQAIKPATENLINKSFYKYDPKKEQSKEIVPYYLNSKPAGDRSYEFTPVAYQAIGKALNVSPLQVQNALEGYLAGYVKIPVNLIQNFNNMAEGKDVEKNRIPLMRRFIQETYPNPSTNPSIVSYEQMMSGTPTIPNKEKADLLGKASAAEANIDKKKITDSQANQKKLTAEEKQIRDTVRATGQNIVTSDSVYYLTATGKVQELSKDFAVETPQLTGQKELDKSIISSFKSEITSKKTTVKKLFELGQLTAEQANAELIKLDQLSKGASSGKGKKGTKSKGGKVTIQSVKAPRTTIRKSVIRAPGFKLKKSPTFKLSKPKTSNIKLSWGSTNVSGPSVKFRNSLTG